MVHLLGVSEVLPTIAELRGTGWGFEESPSPKLQNL